MSLLLFGDAEHPIKKFEEKKKYQPPKEKLSDKIQLSEFRKPAQKVEEKKVVVVEKRSNRVSDDKVFPLSDEQRKILFPNGAIPLSQLKKRKAYKAKKKEPTLKELFVKDMLDCQSAYQHTLMLTYFKKGLTVQEARDAIEDLIYTHGFSRDI